MLSNLTQRERFLAILVGSMLPILLLFAFGYWFYSSYQSTRTQINAKKRLIDKEENLADQVRFANYRRDWYRDISLPSDLSVAKSDYKDWLSKLADSKLRYQKAVSVTPEGNATPVKLNGRKEIFHELKFRVSAYTTLDKLTEFLYEFHRFNQLHKIGTFTVKPVDRKKPGGDMERTNEINVTMKIEVIALVDAAEDRNVFASLTHDLPKTLEQYKQEIVHRDIFGPANNAPTISTVATQRYDEGDHVDFQIIGDDVDEDDELKFELTDVDETLVDALKMNQRGRSARLDAGKLSEGSYRFAMRVTDNGCPAKSYEKKFTIRVNKKVVTKEQPKDPEPVKPKFQHARAAHITAIIQTVTGDPEVWVNVRTLKKVYELNVGSTFEMDGFDWVVKNIDVDKKKVVIARDGEEFVYSQSDFLFRKLPIATSDKSKDKQPEKEESVKRE